jgi:mannose-6-phosphate isomerase-like protein (cupin superfamily)
MDLEEIKAQIVTNVYNIKADKKVSLHKHNKQDEIFYCVKGEGFGVLENSELFVSSFLVPIVNSERLG